MASVAFRRFLSVDVEVESSHLQNEHLTRPNFALHHCRPGKYICEWFIERRGEVGRAPAAL